MADWEVNPEPAAGPVGADHDPTRFDPERSSSGEERARTVGDPDHAPEE